MDTHCRLAAIATGHADGLVIHKSPWFETDNLEQPVDTLVATHQYGQSTTTSAGPPKRLWRKRQHLAFGCGDKVTCYCFNLKTIFPSCQILRRGGHLLPTILVRKPKLPLNLIPVGMNAHPTAPQSPPAACKYDILRRVGTCCPPSWNTNQNGRKSNTRGHECPPTTIPQK